MWIGHSYVNSYRCPKCNCNDRITVEMREHVWNYIRGDIVCWETVGVHTWYDRVNIRDQDTGITIGSIPLPSGCTSLRLRSVSFSGQYHILRREGWEDEVCGKERAT